MVDTKKMDEIINDLRGTCADLDLDVDELTTEECLYLDQYITRCDICSWWYDCDEMSENDGEICNECAEN